MQVGDQAEGDHDSDAVGIDGGVWHSLHVIEKISDEAGDHGFADPAKGEADHGDAGATLDAVDDFIEVLVEALDDARAGAAGVDELLDAGVADADQGELRSREKRVRRHQEKDQEYAEQHEGDHLWVTLMGPILTFQRGS